MKKPRLGAIICVVLLVMAVMVSFCSCQMIINTDPDEADFVGNVFQIVVKDMGGQPIATGSGFVFNDAGWFITNAHVMEDAYYAQAIFNIPNVSTGKSFTYLDIDSGTYCNLDRDIYIGKIENYVSIVSYYKEIPFSTSYKIGETTYSVGYPNSSAELVINKGKITEMWSDIYEKLYSGNTYICSSSEIAHGSSGGVLVNSKREVIGLTTYVWESDYGFFQSGAAISAFNFINIVEDSRNTAWYDLKSLITRFHSKEQAYIELFNSGENSSLAEKTSTKDGAIAYVYTWENESTTNDGSKYTLTEKLSIGSDCRMSHYKEVYWENGDRRRTLLDGYYDPDNEFAEFKFTFIYEWGTGKYYAVTSSNINYSPTIALTLNHYETEHSSYYFPSAEDITYAKERFNESYEYLSNLIAKFK